MIIYDIIIIAAIAIFAILGFWRGVIRETFDAAGIIIGVLVASQFAPGIGAALPPKAIPQIIRMIGISILIILAVWLVARICCTIVRKVIRHGPVKSVDRLGGFVMGSLKGALVVLAIAVLVSIVPFQSKAVKNAPVYNTTMKIARPLAKSYRKALVKSIKESLNRAVVSTIDSVVPESVKKTARKLKSNHHKDDSSEDIGTLKITLADLSPESEKLFRGIIADQKLVGIDGDQVYDMLKESGTTLEIQLAELDPESRKQIKKYIDAEIKDEKDIERLSRDLGVDLGKLSEQLDRN